MIYYLSLCITKTRFLNEPEVQAGSSLKNVRKLLSGIPCLDSQVSGGWSQERSKLRLRGLSGFLQEEKR